MAEEPVLLIHLADLPSLAAAGLEREPERLVLWRPADGGPGERRRRIIVERQVDALGAADIIEARNDSAPDSPEGLRIGRMLLEAASSAARLGARRVVWPVAVGGDLDAMGRAIERAGSVQSLAAEANRDPDVVIELPVIDLRDEQLVALADDSGLPLEAFQPCDQRGDEPCGRCGGCRRWRSAFDEADVTWPWAALVARHSAS